MMKHVAANALTVIIVALVGLAIAVSWVKNQYSGPGPLTAEACLRVPTGSRFFETSETLAAMGAISDARIFRAGAAYQDKDHLLKAGSYLIRPGASMAEIVAQITTASGSACADVVNYRIGQAKVDVAVRQRDSVSGEMETAATFVPGVDAPPPEYSEAMSARDVRLQVTLAEGVTSWQVGEALKQAEFLSGEVKRLPKEGMIAPTSYDVKPGADRQALLDDMEAKQRALLAEIWETRDEGLPFATSYEALILASIIEKETAVADERRTIAQVLVNRLKKGMKLQFDPTIIYGITRGQGTFDREIRQSDIDGKTEQREHGKIEYNTYVITGLPSGPITNPGRSSIEAAVHPDGSNYLYFVADGSGGHAFAATLAEHQKNVAKWRAIQAQGSGN